MTLRMSIRLLNRSTATRCAKTANITRAISVQLRGGSDFRRSSLHDPVRCFDIGNGLRVFDVNRYRRGNGAAKHGSGPVSVLAHVQPHAQASPTRDAQQLWQSK